MWIVDFKNTYEIGPKVYFKGQSLISDDEKVKIADLISDGRAEILGQTDPTADLSLIQVQQSATNAMNRANSAMSKANLVDSKAQNAVDLATEAMNRTMTPGPKGDDGTSPTNQELVNLITPLIPSPIKGDSPTNQQLTSLITPLIPPAIPGAKGDKGDAGSSPTNADLLALFSANNYKKSFSLNTTANVPLIALGGFTDLTFTVSGAAVGMLVAVNLIDTSLLGNLSQINAWVSATNTVTVRLTAKVLINLTNNVVFRIRVFE